ncbi:MAG: HlyD family efflux transporter periplasmic adaptor subunit [Planctomycetota bacterium]
MTTTISSPAPSSVAPAKSSPSRRNPGRTTASQTWMRIGFALVGIGILALAGWGLSLLTAGPSAEVADRALVANRAFNVVLKEKGELRAAKSTDISCEVEGRSTIIKLIPEGTAVKEGDVLVELASAEIEDKIRQSELKEANSIAALEAAQADLQIQQDKNNSDIRKASLEVTLKSIDLEKYREGEWMQKLRDAEIAIEQAEVDLERRQEDFLASQKLFEKGYTTRAENEDAEFRKRKAAWDIEKAKMAKVVLENYTDKADRAKRESDVEEAKKDLDRVAASAKAQEAQKTAAAEGKTKELELIQAELAKLRTQHEKCRIVAPTQGFVVYAGSGGSGRRFFMSAEEQIKEGATVFERQMLMQLPDTSVMNAVVRVHEAKTDKLRSGQKAVVTIEGIPGRTFPGEVTKIAVLADSQSSWLNPDLKEYETEITLDATDVPLKPGVTAHAEIHVQTVEDVVTIPVQSVYSKGGKRYVFRDTKRGPEYVEVSLGAVGTEWAEVKSGVEAGDQVLLALNEDLKRTLPEAQAGERGPGGTQRGRGGPRGGQAGGPGMNAPARGPAGGKGDVRGGPPGAIVQVVSPKPEAGEKDKTTTDGAAASDENKKPEGQPPKEKAASPSSSGTTP